MEYQKLKEVLLSNNVYELIKSNEDILFNLFPELKICKGFNQNNEWHIYDVYEHILNVISGVENTICLRFSALFHDIGKPYVYTEDINGVGHFYNHWIKSLEIFNKYKDRFGLTLEEISLISNLIFYHDFNVNKMNFNSLEKMINSIGKENIKLLFSLKKADLLAQSPKYHFLLKDIENDEKKILKYIKK